MSERPKVGPLYSLREIAQMRRLTISGLMEQGIAIKNPPYGTGETHMIGRVKATTTDGTGVVLHIEKCRPSDSSERVVTDVWMVKLDDRRFF